MPSVLITGANRGLGLEFVRQYAGDGWRVWACCRRPAEAEALAAVAREAGQREAVAPAGSGVTVHALEVDRQASVDALAAELGEVAIDVLINCAGIYFRPESSYRSVNFDDWERAFRVNTLGPMRVTQALVECVARGERKAVVMITSDMGSIGGNRQGYAYEYRTSKAALNALTRNLDIELRPRGMTVVALHPGWVKTDMGGPQAPLGVVESVAGMRRVIGTLSSEHAGRCYDYQGDRMEW